MQSYRILSYFLLSISCAMAEEQLTFGKQQTQNLGIQTSSLKETSEIQIAHAPGRISIPPAHDVIVSSPQSGLIKNITVTVGEQVEKGQILALLESPDLLALKQRYLTTENQLQIAENQFIRDQRMFKEGIIAERRLKESQSHYRILSTELSEATQLLTVAGLSTSEINRLSKNRQMAGTSPIRAPFTGIVLERKISTGQRVAAMAALFRVANMKQLWVEIYVPQEQATRIQPNDELTIEGYTVKAKIALIGRSVNPHNQTVMVRAILENPPPNLLAGQTIRATIIRKGQSPLFVIPDSSIARKGDQTVVFISNDNGFEVKPVTIIAVQNRDFIVQGKLNRKEKIVTHGVATLKAHWLGIGGSD
ncbi:MAG: efflux RND transporter periplasmic adaptor subunit [Methylococcales bacterium]